MKHKRCKEDKTVLEAYNYYENVKWDVENYLDENDIQLTEDNYDEVYDQLWVADSVTGNASGSYTFNTWKAEENLCHNMELLEEAFNEFGLGIEELANGAEYCDVTIRCYLLGQALSRILEELR